MYREVKEGGTLSVEHVKRVLRGAFPHADMQDILGVDSEYDEKRKVERVEHCKRKWGKTVKKEIMRKHRIQLPCFV